MNREVFAAVTAALERGEPAALVTIIGTTGSTPQRVGAKMLVFGDGRIVGTIGGGCYENDAFGKAREAIRSRKKVARIYEELSKGSLAPDALSRVHAPIGLDIGAVTPQEIAVSILAELIAVKHGKDDPRPLRWTPPQLARAASKSDV